MTWNAPSDRHRYVLGGMTSLAFHGALVLGVSGAPPCAPSAEAGASLVWLEPIGGVEGGGAGSESLHDVGEALPASAPTPSMALQSRRPPRSVHRAHHTQPEARPARSRPPLATDETRESLEALMVAATSAEPPGGRAIEGVDPFGSAGRPVAGTAPGGSGAHAGSGAGGEGGGAAPARGPRLLSWSNPCAGHFPSGAQVAHGRVQVEVEVGTNGRIASTRVMVEQPLGEGFGGAARACAEQLRFSPAQTPQGTPVAGRARLLLSFDRS